MKVEIDVDELEQLVEFLERRGVWWARELERARHGKGEASPAARMATTGKWSSNRDVDTGAPS